MGDYRQAYEAMVEALARFNYSFAAEQCEALIQGIASGEADARLIKDAMKALRRKRRFEEMLVLADAALAYLPEPPPVIERFYAQALVDSGQCHAALRVLERYAEQTKGVDPEEYDEARGLIGRVYKQHYVNRAARDGSRDQEALRKGVEAYLEVYQSAPATKFWHGINVVAMVQRARRDGLRLPLPDARPIAATIQAKSTERYAAQQAALKVGDSPENPLGYWDLATAMEACVALGEPEQAVIWLGRYLDARNPAADAFELHSTLRQLTEVWQLTSDKPPGNVLLPLLRSALMSRDPDTLAPNTTDIEQDAERDPLGLVNELKQRASGADGIELEKLFNAATVPYRWYMLGANRCRAVGLISTIHQAVGTGFLMDGKSLKEAWDFPVLVTNAHCVTNDETVLRILSPKPCRPDEVSVRFEIWDQPAREFRVAELLWTSAPGSFDASVLRLEGLEARPAFVEAIPLEPLPAPPRETEPRPRAYVIGHPGGRELALSLDNSIVLDVESPRIHYRTPTEEGSSGSPVFDAQWRLIALHHGGRDNLPRLNGKPGTYQANEGIGMTAIRDAIRAAG